MGRGMGRKTRMRSLRSLLSNPTQTILQFSFFYVSDSRVLLKCCKWTYLFYLCFAQRAFCFFEDKKMCCSSVLGQSIAEHAFCLQTQHWTKLCIVKSLFCLDFSVFYCLRIIQIFLLKFSFFPDIIFLI